MKKLAIAGLLAAALSLTALSQQKASAWGCGSSGEFNLSIGFSISGSWQCNPCCGGCGGCGYGYCPDVSMYSAPACGYGGYCAAPYAAPQAAPTAAPVAATGVQNAAYYPANYGYNYGYGYGYYQAPSYWYGREARNRRRRRTAYHLTRDDGPHPARSARRPRRFPRRGRRFFDGGRGWKGFTGRRVSSQTEKTDPGLFEWTYGPLEGMLKRSSASDCRRGKSA